MSDFDGAVFRLLNGWFGGSAEVYNNGLAFLARGPWIVAILILAGLWFVGEPGAVAIQPGSITRLESRRRVLMLFLALLGTFLIARLLQLALNRPAPLSDLTLNLPLTQTEWQALHARLALHGSFPNEYAALLAVMVTGAFAVRRWFGVILCIGLGYLSILLIGSGLAWLSDIFAGILLGILIGTTALALLPLLRPVLDPFLLLYDRYPGLMYALSFLLLLDMSQQFSVLFGVVRLVTGYAISGY